MIESLVNREPTESWRNEQTIFFILQNPTAPSIVPLYTH